MTEAGEVEAVLYDTLAKHRNLSREAVRDEVGADGAIDSLEGVELIVAAEAHFGVVFADDEITSQLCRSIPLLAAAVAAKAGGAIH